MSYEVEGVRGRQRTTWNPVVERYIEEGGCAGAQGMEEAAVGTGQPPANPYLSGENGGKTCVCCAVGRVN